MSTKHYRRNVAASLAQWADPNDRRTAALARIGVIVDDPTRSDAERVADVQAVLAALAGAVSGE